MTAATSTQTQVWPISKIRPNPLNPRGDVLPETVQDLAASIKAQGILQPLLVTERGVLVAGHRRRVAAIAAGLAEAPVIVRELSVTEQLEIMLVENLQRQDLSPIQEAKGYKGLLDRGCTSADVARKVGVTVARVSSRSLLLRLDEQVQWMVHRGDLPLALAPVLLKVPDPERQRRLAARAVNHHLTVAQVERLVDDPAAREILATPPPKPARAPSEPELQSPGRRQALAVLEQLGGRTVTLLEMARVFRDVCCACGMEDLPGYCAECPMLQMVNGVVAGVARAEGAPRAA